MLHISFSPSAAGIIRRILRTAGKKERVLGWIDNLAEGPIRDATGAERRAWCLNPENWMLDEEHTVREWRAQLEFWSIVDDLAQRPLMVWLSRRSSMELCGYLEFVTRLTDLSDVQIADFSEEVFLSGGGNPSPYRPVSLGAFNQEMMGRGFEIVGPPDEKIVRIDRTIWQRLKGENAPIRGFVAGQLVSVAENHFDWALLDSVATAWRPAPRVVGDSLCKLWDQDDRAEVGDQWLFRRLRVLDAAGEVEFDGPGKSRDAKVRLRKPSGMGGNRT